MEAPPPVVPAPPSPGVRVLGVALAVVTVLVYSPGLRADFLWDDHALIQHNPGLRSVAALATALTRHFWSVPTLAGPGIPVNQYYRPVVTLALGLQWLLLGDHPVGYHLVSLALHVTCTLLAFRWLLRRLGDSDAVVVPSALAAGLFAVHPTRPESVTWILGSTDLWMTLWTLAGLSFWDRRRDALAAGCLVLAMLSKETAMVVPALLATDAALCAPSPAVRRADLGRVGALALVVGAVTALRLVLFSGRAASAAPSLAGDSLRRVLATLGWYVRATVFHWPPTVMLGLRVRDAAHRPVYALLPVVLGALVAGGYLTLAGWSARDVRVRRWLADALWFLVPLAPVLNLVDMRVAVLGEPHNLYLPLLGVCALLARAATVVVAPRTARVVTAGAIGILMAAAGVSIFHQRQFRSDLTLWSWEHRVAPDNLLVVLSLTEALRSAGRPLDALRLDCQGVLAAQRTGLRATTAVLARGAVQDTLRATHPDDEDTARRVVAFCEAMAHPGTPARLDVLGQQVAVPADAPWRSALARDPLLQGACVAAANRARAASRPPLPASHTVEPR